VQLRSIDKKRYRDHSKKSTFGAIAILLGGSLLLSSVLIHLVGDVSGSNFNLNLVSIIVMIVLMIIALIKLRHKPFFSEMDYMWRVKFELSHINRKISAVEKLAKNNNAMALDILAYYYQATKQVWQLDDNTISMEEFIVKENKFKQWLADANYVADVNNYSRTELYKF